MTNELRGYDDFYASMLTQVHAFAGAIPQINMDAPATQEALARHLAGNLWAFVQLDRRDRQEAHTAMLDALKAALMHLVDTSETPWNGPLVEEVKAAIDLDEGVHDAG